MKFFKELMEELSFSQKKDIDKQTRGLATPSLYEHLPDALKHEDTIYHPLDEHSHDVPIHSGVQAHLENHGYKIPSPKDYVAGYALDSHGRMPKIGKVLKSTGAPQEIIHAFENDEHRALAKKSDLMIAYTRNPHHVAGMSTDRGWTSCMDLAGGTNAHYVPDEIKAGTHVAYLIHKDDKGIRSPVARIALKPFKSTTSDHMILRPENMTYGTGNSKFEHEVSKFADMHFPAIHDESYVKHHGVYDDSNGYDKTYTKHSPEAVDQSIKSMIKTQSTTELNKIHVKDLTEGIKRLPAGSKERSAINDLMIFHKSSAGAHDHVANEVVEGNVDAGVFQNSTLEGHHILNPNVANKLVEDGHYKKMGKHASENLMDHPKLSYENKDTLFFHVHSSPSDYSLPNDPGPKATKAVTKLVEDSINHGGLMRISEQASHVKKLASSKHTSMSKLKSIFVKTFDDLPQEGASTFTSDVIGRLKKNPNYTMTHAKSFDRGLIDLGHSIGEHRALFATTHPDATVDTYKKYQERNPGDHFTRIDSVSRIIRKHTPDKIFEHEYANHEDPVHFAAINDMESRSRATTYKHEIEALNKSYSAHKTAAGIEHINPDKPKNYQVSELLRRRVHDVAMDHFATRGNLIPILHTAIKNGDDDLADTALTTLSGEYPIEKHHIDKFKKAFPRKVDDINNRIQEGDIKVR